MVKKIKDKKIKESKSLVRENALEKKNSTPTRNNKSKTSVREKSGKQENHTTALILSRKTQCIIGFRLVNQCNH